MTKIGILTLYYKNYNYGGSLQSYALCRFLNESAYSGKDVTAEQICYDRIKKEISDRESRTRRSLIRYLVDTYKTQIFNLLKDKFNARIAAFDKFNQECTPHSGMVYSGETISGVCESYDLFVVGSDQVWNPKLWNSGYLLSFVKNSEKKVSYGASISNNMLNNDEKDILRDSLGSFKAISVREESSKKELQSLTDIPVCHVVDPTLLLDKAQWNEIAEKDDTIKNPYIFCYFLGTSSLYRNIAKKYARKKNLKIVTLPNFPFTFTHTDIGFADINLYDVSPKKFISLIRGAEMIFTDSYHATIFSLIYKKEFFVFDRKNFKDRGDVRHLRGTRISELMNMFEITERYCDSTEKETLEYIENIPSINYGRGLRKFEELRMKSIEFIKQNIIEG